MSIDHHYSIRYVAYQAPYQDTVCSHTCIVVFKYVSKYPLIHFYCFIESTITSVKNIWLPNSLFSDYVCILSKHLRFLGASDLNPPTPQSWGLNKNWSRDRETGMSPIWRSTFWEVYHRRCDANVSHLHSLSIVPFINNVAIIIKRNCKFRETGIYLVKKLK